MEKRVFLAILLSFVVLALYQTFLAPPPPVPPPAAAGGGLQTPPVASAPGTPGTTPPGGAAVEAAATPAAPVIAPIVADTAARDIVVETNAVRAVFTTAGAALKSFILKGHFDEGQPLDLVPQDLPAELPRPFTISTDADELSARLRQALYRPTAASLSLQDAPGTLTFEYRDASGLNARKTFHFQPDRMPYVLRVEATVDVNGASRPVTVHWGPAIGRGLPSDGSGAAPSGVVLRGDEIERMAQDAVAERPRHEGELRFAGVEQHYFMSAVLPGSQPVRVDFQPVTVPGPDPETPRQFVSYSVTPRSAANLAFFMGPKDLDVLRVVDPQLVRAIDFGMFGFLVVPLLQALKWLNSFLHNYGWSIFTLTVIINVLIFPLRHKSMVSMKKMQTLQPQIKVIQDRYKNLKFTDPAKQKMQTEIMALYKEKGVSPASGCVPMLLTLPILYAFYQMLFSAIELRGAPFMGWITDLSRHDPFYITPVVMGATMFWQQKMMPATTDPVQRKIFLAMPIIFTVTFLRMPSGLVLYWLVSNVLAIGQQYLTNHLIAAPARASARGSASRSGK